MPKIISSTLQAYRYHNRIYPSDWSKLHKAVACNYLSKITQLVRDPACLCAIDSLGCTPVHIAVLFNRPEALKKLIQAGARLDIRDKQGHTALQMAFNAGRPELVALLFNKPDVFSYEGAYY